MNSHNRRALASVANKLTNVNTPTNNGVGNDFGFPFFGPPETEDMIKTYRQIIPVTVYHFYITTEIGDVSRFLELINTLKTAEQHDTIFIYLNTPGGSLTTTIQIINAMKQSQATVVTCLEGEVCSAGTMIFLAGKNHVVNAYGTFMIHNASYGFGGKWNDVTSQVSYTDVYIKNLFHSIYANFLTTTEIAEVLSGKDFWLDSEGVLKRISPPVKESEVVQSQIENLLNGDVGGVLTDTVEGAAIVEILEEAIKVQPKKKPTPKVKSKKKP